MKKIIAIIAAIAAVAAAGWSGLWFVGRGAVAERIDREIAQMQALGFEITHGSREIGGFPFAYRVTHHDVAIVEPTSGAVYRLPEVTTEATAGDGDRLVTQFPAKYRIDVPLDEAQRASLPGMPEVLAIDIESSDMVVISDGVPGEGQEIAITAKSLLIVTGGADQPLNFAFDFTAFDSTSTLPALSSGAAATSATTVERLDYAYTSIMPDGVTANLEASIDNLRMTAKTDVRDQPGLLALLGGGTGIASLTYQTGASKGTVKAGSAPEQPDGTLDFSAGSTAGTFMLTNGVFEVSSVSQANLITVTSPGETPSGPFGAEIRSVEMQVSGPLAPSENMVATAFKFAIDQISVDDAVWQLIDADGKLPHDPAKLIIDLEGTARITNDLSKHRPGDPAPFEVGNVAIRSAEIAALGAEVAATGNFEFVQPSNQPVGELDVTLSDVEATLIKLADAGLIDPSAVEMAMLMSTGYLVAGTKPGEMVTKIVVSEDGFTINGQPMGAN